MPESFAVAKCSYQPRAQPYLEAIARGFRGNAASRAFLLEETKHEAAYAGAEPLWQEQWQERDPTDSMKCPFWSSYWYVPCSICDCRIDNSVSMEIDAMFFLRSSLGKTLAIHIEMKRDNEPLSHGQADAYRPKGECYRDERRTRKGLLKHDDFITVLFCGMGTDIEFTKRHFDRVILHTSARDVFPDYPIG